MSAPSISASEDKLPNAPLPRLNTQQSFSFFGKKVSIDNISKLRFAFIAVGLISLIGLGIAAIGYASSHQLLPKQLVPLDRFKLLDSQWSFRLLCVTGVSTMLSTIAVIRLALVNKSRYYSEQSQQFSNQSEIVRETWNAGIDQIKIAKEKLEPFAPCKDNLETTKRKIHSALNQISSLKDKLSLDLIELENAKELEIFLNTDYTEEAWQEETLALKKSLEQTYHFLFIELASKYDVFIENDRLEFLSALIKKYSSVFKTKLTDAEIQTLQTLNNLGLIENQTKETIERDLKNNLCIQLSEHWFYFPIINFAQDLDKKKTNLDKCYSLLEQRSSNGESVYDRENKINYIPDHRFEELSKEESKQNIESLNSELEVRHQPFSSLIKPIAQEYRIRLMPKAEFTFATVEKLLEILSANDSLRECIASFYVKRDTNDINFNGMNVPLIVIFPKLGKENAQKALDGLVKELYPYFEKWGSGIAPHSSCQGKNPLIFYSQGDTKKKISLQKENPALFKQIFEDSGVHYRSKNSEFHLKPPKHF